MKKHCYFTGISSFIMMMMTFIVTWSQVLANYNQTPSIKWWN